MAHGVPGHAHQERHQQDPLAPEELVDDEGGEQKGQHRHHGEQPCGQADGTAEQRPEALTDGHPGRERPAELPFDGLEQARPGDEQRGPQHRQRRKRLGAERPGREGQEGVRGHPGHRKPQPHGHRAGRERRRSVSPCRHEGSGRAGLTTHLAGTVGCRATHPVQECDLFGQRLDLPLELGDVHGQVDAHRQQEHDGQREHHRGPGLDAHEGREVVDDRTGEDQHEGPHRDPHPQQGEGLGQLPPADELQHDQQEQARDDQDEDLEAHQDPPRRPWRWARRGAGGSRSTVAGGAPRAGPPRTARRPAAGASAPAPPRSGTPGRRRSAGPRRCPTGTRSGSRGRTPRRPCGPKARNPLVVSSISVPMRRDTVRLSSRIMRRRMGDTWYPEPNRDPTAMSAPSMTTRSSRRLASVGSC